MIGRRTGQQLIGLLICLGLVALINSSVPDYDLGTRWYTGRHDELVRSPDLDVQVTSLEFSRQVQCMGSAMATEGVWLIVYWSATAHRQTAHFTRTIELHTTDGLEIGHRQELASCVMPSTPPGFTSHGVAVFEVWPEHLAGADLVIQGSQAALQTYGFAIRVTDIVAAEPTPDQIAELIQLPPFTTEVAR